MLLTSSLGKKKWYYFVAYSSNFESFFAFPIISFNVLLTNRKPFQFINHVDNSSSKLKPYHFLCLSINLPLTKDKIDLTLEPRLIITKKKLA